MLEHRIRLITDAIYNKLVDKQGKLGFQYVGKYDEKRLPKYPSVVVAPGDFGKVLHGTNTFNVEMSVQLWVYHGDMTVPHKTRTDEDLRLVERVETLLEEDYTLGGLVIFGFIATQVPGIVQPSSSKTDVIAGTRMDWVALSQRRMRA